jgi:hypothetical protein
MFSAAVQAVFGADTGPLAKSGAEAEGIVSQFASRASSVLGTLGLGLSAGAVIGFFKGIADKAGTLQDLSESLDVSTDSLQAFTFAARQAGATNEQAIAVLDKTRKAVDSLASGSEATAKQFAAIGLSAKDFVGLKLDESLERIARAYAENRNHAGAFDAVTDILGSKTVPRLNTVLLQVADEGFAGLTKNAKDAGVVIEQDTIKKLDDLGDRVAALQDEAEAAGSKVLGWGVNLGIAYVGVSKIIQDQLGIIELKTKAVGDANGEAAKQSRALEAALVKTSAELKAQKELDQERAKLDEFILKTTIDQADYTGKVAEYKRQMKEHAERAWVVGLDAVAQEKELMKFAQAQEALRKLEVAEREKLIAAKRLAADDELKFAALVLKESKGLTQEEKTQLDVYRLQMGALENLYKVKLLLAKGVENLTAGERETLRQLFDQRTKLEEQIADKKALIAATREQVGEEKKVNAELEQQKVYRLTIKKGREDKDLSDRELDEKYHNLRRQVDAHNNARARGEWGDPFAAMAAGELEKVMFERNRRSDFRRNYAREGEDAFSRYSAFDEQTLRQYIRPEDERRAHEQIETLRSINQRFGRLLGEG